MKASHLIFDETPENLDETWTHGAVLGGMVGYDDECLAKSYFLAASMLIEQLLSSDKRGQDVICPVLYLYRHGIELYLKVLVKPEKLTHGLKSLLDALIERIQAKYGQPFPEWFTNPIMELAAFDPNSDLFRYGRTKRPSVSRALINGGEFWIDLREVRKTMALIERSFLRIKLAEEVGLERLPR